MTSPEAGLLGVVGAVIGVLVGTGVVGPTVMFSDAGYAMVGVVVSSLIGATATVLVAYITVNSNRRSRDQSRDSSSSSKDEPDPPRQPPRKSR